MQLILTVLHLVLAIGLIGLILIQHGKGADAGAAFGSGASATVFGAQGSGSFLSRTTAIMATLFFFTSIALAYYAARVGEPAGLMDGIDENAPMSVPASVPTVPEAETDLPPAALQFDEPMIGGGDDLPPMDVPDPMEMPELVPPAPDQPPAAGADLAGPGMPEPQTAETAVSAEDDSTSAQAADGGLSESDAPPQSDDVRSQGGSN